MSLARALTKRMRSSEDVSPLSRGFGTRKGNMTIDRAKISLPLGLISSTNNLAYDAPDIPSGISQQQLQNQTKQTIITTTMAHDSETALSSASSRKSYEDSMKSPGLSATSSRTSAEPSREPSPSLSPKLGKSFFFDRGELSPEIMMQEAELRLESPRPQSTEETLSRRSSPSVEVSKPVDAETQASTPSSSRPSIPQRAPSHTKKTHQTLARKRSQRLSSPPPINRSSSQVKHASSEFQSTHVPTASLLGSMPEADHPFGAELQKVNELAEEFGMKDVAIVDEETLWLRENGLRCFSAEDYIGEIRPLFAVAFPAVETWL